MTDRKLFYFTVIALMVVITGCQKDLTIKLPDPGRTVIDLAGQWEVSLDPEDIGEKQKWFKAILPDKITLPGSLTQNGLGDEVTAKTKWTAGFWNKAWLTDKQYEKYRQPGNVKINSWLQPLKHYVGKAWYRKQIDIPENFKGKQITLLLERCHWETKVWVDGKYIGVKNSLSTPNRFRLGKLNPGKHNIALCVDNTLKINVGQDAHSVSDQTQGNWNGVVGKMLLQAQDSVTIDNVQIYPDIENKLAKVVVTVKNSSKRTTAHINLKAESFNTNTKHSVPAVTKQVKLNKRVETFEIQYPMGDKVQLWDEFSPALYKLTVSIEGDGFKDVETTDFGMRQIVAEGREFKLNGKKIFFRGTLECSIFPLTGYPPMNVQGWEKVIKACQAHGLNHIRFHSYCPPQAAFVAADKMGFYFQAEGPFWAKVGDGGDLDKYIYAECDRILKEYGNHPSFMLMAHGNEPSGKNQKKFLGELEKYWRAKDKRRLYSSGSGWPHIPENDYHIDPDPRIQHWGAGLHSRINAKPPETTTDYTKSISKFEVPVISHEIGQWCVYPNFDEMKKYTGILKPKNFEIFRETLEENHMLDQAHDFLMASGKLQTLCYKEDIESALRTKNFGGFQLLDLHDFPGQGTALIGVLDPFWEEKGYVTADEYKRFSGQTVPLARMEKRTWTNDETFTADIEIAHFGQSPITNAKFIWEITRQNKVYRSGNLAVKTIPVDNGIQLGKVQVPLTDIAIASKLNLSVSLEGTDFRNDWDFWVYPKSIDTSRDAHILIAEKLDEKALSLLASGGKVILMPPDKSIKGDVALGFSSIFWNTAWTNGQKPHTLGILCDPKHPALAKFPTEYHSNWQWWDMVSKAQAMIMDEFPPELRPIVQVVDDWFTNRRLGLVFEANVNGGKLLICSINLRSNLDDRPVARQMLHSLKNYMRSDAFKPKHSIDTKLIDDLYRLPSAMEVIGAKVIKTDSENSSTQGHNAIDGDPKTMWHTDWQGDVPGYPHEIVIELKKQVAIKGLTVLPRQDGNKNARIGKYEICVSNDPENWETLAAEGTFSTGKKLKTVNFDKVQTGRFIKLTAVAPIDPQHPWASIAEIEILTEYYDK